MVRMRSTSASGELCRRSDKVCALISEKINSSPNCQSMIWLAKSSQSCSPRVSLKLNDTLSITAKPFAFCLCANLGSTPAWMSDDFPQPLGPSININPLACLMACSDRFNRVSTCRSRPKNTSCCWALKALKPT